MSSSSWGSGLVNRSTLLKSKFTSYIFFSSSWWLLFHAFQQYDVAIQRLLTNLELPCFEIMSYSSLVSLQISKSQVFCTAAENRQWLKKKPADKSKIRILQWRDNPVISRWAHYNHKSPYKWKRRTIREGNEDTWQHLE